MTDDRSVPRDDGRHHDPLPPERDASTELKPAAHSVDDPDREGVLSDDAIVRDIEDRREADEPGPSEAERDAEFGDAADATRSFHP